MPRFKQHLLREHRGGGGHGAARGGEQQPEAEHVLQRLGHEHHRGGDEGGAAVVGPGVPGQYRAVDISTYLLIYQSVPT